MKLIPTYVLIALLCGSFWGMLAAVGLIPAVRQLTGLVYPAWAAPAAFGVGLGGSLLLLLFIGGAFANDRRMQ